MSTINTEEEDGAEFRTANLQTVFLQLCYAYRGNEKHLIAPHQLGEKNKCVWAADGPQRCSDL